MHRNGNQSLSPTPLHRNCTDQRQHVAISDSTIKLEMTVFGQVTNFAIKKRYAPASTRFDEPDRYHIRMVDPSNDL